MGVIVTPFDVLKTRLQTVRPSQTIVPSPFISMPETICCQTAVIRSAKAGPGPSSLRQMASSNMSPQGTTANATCLTANMKASPQSVQLPARFVPAFAASSSTQATSMAIPPAPEGCLHPSKWAGIWGELITNEEAERLRSGGTTTTSSLSELSDQARKGAKELTKRIVSTSAAEGGFWNEIRVILAEPAGWRGLWKGVGTGLIMSIPSASIYMLGYEYLLAGLNGKSMTLASTPRSRNNTDNRATIISQHTPLDHTPTSQSDLPAAATQQAYLSPAPFLAGSMARTISATVISPIELFRTRLQALPARKLIASSERSNLATQQRCF
jgi:solute carrier family 25 protein 39/40